MSSSTTSEPKLRFARKSDAESVCMSCFLTVRADPYTKLEDAEDIHADVCLVREDSVVGYVLL